MWHGHTYGVKNESNQNFNIQLEEALERNNIKKEDFDIALNFLSSSKEEKAKQFAKKISNESTIKQEEFYKLKNPNLGLNIDNFLLLITTQNAEAIKEQYLTGDKIFIITTEE